MAGEYRGLAGKGIQLGDNKRKEAGNAQQPFVTSTVGSTVEAEGESASQILEEIEELAVRLLEEKNEEIDRLAELLETKNSREKGLYDYHEEERQKKIMRNAAIKEIARRMRKRRPGISDRAIALKLAPQCQVGFEQIRKLISEKESGS